MKNLIALMAVGSFLTIFSAQAEHSRHVENPCQVFPLGLTCFTAQQVSIGLMITVGGLPMSTTKAIMDARKEEEDDLLLRAAVQAQEYVELELANFRAELLQDPIFKAALEVIRERRKKLW